MSTCGERERKRIRLDRKRERRDWGGNSWDRIPGLRRRFRRDNPLLLGSRNGLRMGWRGRFRERSHLPSDMPPSDPPPVGLPPPATPAGGTRPFPLSLPAVKWWTAQVTHFSARTHLARTSYKSTLWIRVKLSIFKYTQLKYKYPEIILKNSNNYFTQVFRC